MKCDNCGFDTNPGDQICINCGAKLSVANQMMPKVEENPTKEEKKQYNKAFIYTIIGIVVSIIIIFLIIKYVIL